MRANCSGQILTRQIVTQNSVGGDLRLAAELVDEIGSDNKTVALFDRRAFVRTINLHQRIGKIAIRNRAVGGNGPRSRRPDYNARAFKIAAVCLHDRKANPKRRRFVIMIFNLGFGKRGLFDNRPHNGPHALIQKAGLQKLVYLAQDLRLGLKAHRRIGVLEVSNDTKALELDILRVHPLLGKSTAFGAELGRRDGVLILPLRAILLLYFPFDR